MSELDARLARCFQSVFPDLAPDEIRRASQHSVAAWDSLATVSLIALIEEEFAIQLRDDEFESIISFPLALDCVTTRVSNGR